MRQESPAACQTSGCVHYIIQCRGTITTGVLIIYVSTIGQKEMASRYLEMGWAERFLNDLVQGVSKICLHLSPAINPRPDGPLDFPPPDEESC